MAERPTYKNKRSGDIKKRLAEALNDNGKYGYNAAGDSVYSDYRTGNAARANQAARETVRDAKRINNNDTYSDAVGSSSLHRYLSRTNELVPALERVDYAKEQGNMQEAEMLAGMQDNLEKAMDLWNRAAEVASTTGAVVDGSDSRYLIKRDPRFGDYVFVENVDKRFADLKPDDRKGHIKVAFEILREMYQGKEFSVYGNKYTMNKDSKEEFANKSPYGKHIQIAKIKASTEIKDLLKSGELMGEGIANEKKEKHPSVDSFDYFYVKFKFNNQDMYYTGVLIVSNYKDGRKIIYDIDNIAEIKGNRVQPRFRNLMDFSARFNDSLKNNITDSNLENKSQFSLKRNTDSLGNKLSKGQMEYFKDSKILDQDGNLKVMYHGTNADFTVFDPFVSGGVNGTAEGYGIYFAGDKEISDAYGGKVYEGYLNVTRPAAADKKTITSSELQKLIEATIKNEAAEMVEAGEYDNVDDAIKDTWISNYVYTYDQSIDKSVKEVANQILSQESNDFNIIQEVMSGLGVSDYKSAYKFYDILTDKLGIDGFTTQWTDRATGKKTDIVVALHSNQFKNADNLNPTENEDVRFSLKRSGHWMNRMSAKERIALKVQQNRVTSYVSNVLKNPANYAKECQVANTINPRLAKDINDLLGLNIGTDCKTLLNKSAVEHIDKRHGKNGKADQTMSEIEDYEIIPSVIANYDGLKEGNDKIPSAFKNYDGSRAKKIELSEHVPDGTNYVIEAIATTKDGNAKLWIVSAYKDYSANKKSTGAGAVWNTVSATSETRSAHHSAFDESTISENNDSDNSLFSLKRSGLDFDAKPEQSANKEIAQETIDMLNGFTISEDQVDAFINKRIRKFMSDADTSEIKKQVKTLAEYLNGQYKKSADMVMSSLQDIAKDIMEGAHERDTSMDSETGNGSLK